MNRIVVFLFLAGILASCNASPEAEPGVAVVATTSILGDVASGLVGEEGSVEVLMGPGVDPHDFSASASQATLLRSADLVVANGLGLEAGLEDLLESAAADGAHVVELAEELDPLPVGGGDTEHSEEAGEEDDHDHEGQDPHFFLDPLRMADAVDLMAAALAEVEPRGEWNERAQELRADLETLHRDIEQELSRIPQERRKLVTNHDALGYFADRYGFEVVGTVIPGGSTLAEPSAADLAELVEVLRRESVTAIFGETSEPSTLAETVAAEIGEQVEVYSLHTESLGEPGSEADSYEGMMRENAAIIARALGS